MGTEARTESRIRTHRRQIILDAALRLFAEKGYEATPVPAIAEAAGLAVGGLYRYYPGKEQLVNAVFQRSKVLFGSFIGEGFAEKPDVRAKFRHLWNRMEAFSRTHPHDFVFLELHNHSAYLDRQSRAVEKEMQQPFIRFIQAAQKSGDMRAMEANLTMSLVLGLFLACYRAVQGGLIANPGRALRQAEEAAWRAVAKNPP